MRSFANAVIMPVYIDMFITILSTNIALFCARSLYFADAPCLIQYEYVRWGVQSQLLIIRRTSWWSWLLQVSQLCQAIHLWDSATWFQKHLSKCPQPTGAITGLNWTELMCDACTCFFAACNCFGHADTCFYDEAVSSYTPSLNAAGVRSGGGVCMDCQHNTTGNSPAWRHCRDCFLLTCTPLSRILIYAGYQSPQRYRTRTNVVFV